MITFLRCTFFQINNITKMATQSAQTLDVYKSVQVQTTASIDVCTNTLSEKATNTNQQIYHLSINVGCKTPAI